MFCPPYALAMLVRASQKGDERRAIYPAKHVLLTTMRPPASVTKGKISLVRRRIILHEFNEFFVGFHVLESVGNQWIEVLAADVDALEKTVNCRLIYDYFLSNKWANRLGVSRLLMRSQYPSALASKVGLSRASLW